MAIAQPKNDSDTISMGIPTIILHAVVFLFQLPLLMIYFANLWIQPHYQFFPIVLLLVGILFFFRVKKSQIEEQFRSNWFGNACLTISIICLLFANYVFEPQAAAVGCFFLAGSLLSRFKDLETGRSLLPLWVLLALIVRPPFNLDIRLITKLQIMSSNFASSYLDLAGVKHYLDGNRVIVGNQEFFVEEACSGVISLFSLMFMTLGYVVITRRTFLRAVLLILASLFWSAFMNTIRIFVVVYAHARWDMDLAHGLRHDILGYVMLGFALLMVISTDCFLTFMFGPVEIDPEKKSRFQRFSEWMKGVFFPNATGSNRRRLSITKVGIIFMVALCSIGVVAGSIPLIKLGPSGVVSQVGKTFELYDVEKSALPEKLPIKMVEGAETIEMTWETLNFGQDERDRNSDWGSRSSYWGMATREGFRTRVSCDYPFVGWHDLSTCYRGNGWTIVSRRVEEPKDREWKYVILELQKSTGQYMYVFFSLFDEYGYGSEPIARTVADLNFFHRATTAMQRRLNRDYGPYPQTYQVQNIIETSGPLDRVRLKFFTMSHDVIREHLRQHVIGNLHEMDVPDISKTPEADETTP